MDARRRYRNQGTDTEGKAGSALGPAAGIKTPGCRAGCRCKSCDGARVWGFGIAVAAVKDTDTKESRPKDPAADVKVDRPSGGMDLLDSGPWDGRS